MSTDRSTHTPQAGFEGAALREIAGSVQGNEAPATGSHVQVPDAIERRYLRIGDRYFFPDRTLAFIDDGNRIRVRTENQEVLHSVIAIAQTRGWKIIELAGTEAFRQGMWRAAALRGIEAQGYEPTQAEIVQMQRTRQKLRPSRETEQSPMPVLLEQRTAPTREGSDASDSGRDADGYLTEAAQGGRHLREGPRPPIKGALVAAAAAPYQFDSAQRMSFYATVRTEAGERTIWGADLERALAESYSRPRIGDQVVLAQRGSRPVAVRVATRNAQGELVGEKRIVAQRARWSIETPERLRAMEQRAMRVRTEELLSDAMLDRHPELATAAASIRLAEQYAKRLTGDQASQRRLVRLIRDRVADALEQGRAIHLPARRLQATPMQVRQRTGRGQEELGHDRF